MACAWRIINHSWKLRSAPNLLWYDRAASVRWFSSDFIASIMKRDGHPEKYEGSYPEAVSRGGSGFSQGLNSSHPETVSRGGAVFSQGLNSSHPFGRERNFYYRDLVKGVVDEDRRSIVMQSEDFVHIKLLKNNTFVTLTDSKGDKKFGASSGSVPEMKGGAKSSRYAAEGTAEHIGRLARNSGIKSVVVRVKGFVYFKKKKQAILSFREGFTNGRGDQNPIVYIEDTTRKPHNGCRLPRKRRV